MVVVIRTLLALLLGLTVVQADYLFELDLQEYSNPGGKKFNDRCCETQGTNPVTGECLPIDTCDPRFHIRLQNLRVGLTPIGQDYILGTFSDADSISFGNCQPIISPSSSTGVQNPLRFTFPTSEFSPRDTLTVVMDISHIEGRQSNIIVENFVQPIDNIPGTNATFSGNLTYYASAPSVLTVQFRYRLICTAGFCGNDCSQSSDCPGFSQACVPDCNQNEPCLNGGTCENERCQCTASYEGARCETLITVPTMTTTTGMTSVSSQPKATTVMTTPSPAASSDTVTLRNTTMILKNMLTSDKLDDGIGAGSAFLTASLAINLLLSFICLLLMSQ